MLQHDLKMVIWDLDETFWRGTLTEGDVTVPAENCDIVMTLSRRGIISSICSKNNFEAARRVLEDNNAWCYFVFPHIEFSAKGAAIAELIERANLRPDNVLFIDDNRLNLEEARYYAPNLMTAHPDEILPVLLSLPQARGKDDTNLSRLNQYKQLEKKVRDRTETSLKNEEFLKQCDIKVAIDVDVESSLDRVVELINRSNQLNFTKKRLETGEDISAFRAQLRKYGFHAGVVKASDKYGDYGIVGFFMTSRFHSAYDLIHFVFSCRIMNMGIEQYVYELLGEPRCTIVPPVSNGLKDFAYVDWISDGEIRNAEAPLKNDAKLLLIGGCDLLQTATYCSTRRAEYVNRVNRGVMARYDDPGFVLSARDAIVASGTLPLVPCWTKDDVLRFDNDLADAEVIIASFWEAMNGCFMVLEDGIFVRVAPGFLGRHLRLSQDTPYLERARLVRLPPGEKLDLAIQSFDRIAGCSPRARIRFLIGANTRKASGAEVKARAKFNDELLRYCERYRKFEFISVDEIVPEDELLDAQHFTRKGYFALAGALKERMENAAAAAPEAPAPMSAAKDFREVLVRGEPLELAAIAR
jgi:FkbH-like protein